MIYLFLADGFEEIEALSCVDILRRAGLDVFTVGVTGKTVTGAHGIKVEADIPISECSEDAEMVILPGGSVGTDNLAASAEVAALVRGAARRNAYVAAICAAPTVLGGLGLLAGRRAVCYPGLEGRLTGATKCADRVCIDGNFITSRGPGTTAEFALTLIGILAGGAVADQLRKGMLW